MTSLHRETLFLTLWSAVVPTPSKTTQFVSFTVQLSVSHQCVLLFIYFRIAFYRFPLHTCISHVSFYPHVQVAIRALGFDVKKADVQKIMSDCDKHNAGKILLADFTEISMFCQAC